MDLAFEKLMRIGQDSIKQSTAVDTVNLEMYRVSQLTRRILDCSKIYRPNFQPIFKKF